MYTLHGHKQGPTTSAVFSPGGDFFATGGSDSQVMVWKSNFLDIAKSGQLNHDSSSSQKLGGMVTVERSDSPENIHKLEKSGNSSPVPQKSKAAPMKSVEPVIVAKPSSVPLTNNSLANNHGIPENLSNTLSQIIRQMDVLTQTMSIIENRLSMNEDRVSSLNQINRREYMMESYPQQTEYLNQNGGDSPPDFNYEIIKEKGNAPLAQIRTDRNLLDDQYDLFAS